MLKGLQTSVKWTDETLHLEDTISYKIAVVVSLMIKAGIINVKEV